MITTVIGAYCPVCKKDQFHSLSYLILSARRDGEFTDVKLDKDNYILECQKCNSIECTTETFLSL